MRVDNQPVNNTLISATGAGAAQRVASSDTKFATTAAGTAASDQATLSSASNLVALAKNATSAARQAKISALTEQVRSGSYQGDTGQAGRGMVGELLSSRTSAAS